MKDIDIGILAATGENAEFVHRVEEALNKASENITKQTLALGNGLSPQYKGNFAEIWHAETFNADAVLNRMDNVKAEVLNLNTYKSPDITVKVDGKTASEISLKYWSKAKQSVDQQKGYPGQERLIPDDQVNEAQEHLKRQIPKDYATGRENRIKNAQKLEEIQENLTSKVKHGDAESQKLDLKESERKLKAVRRGESLDLQPQIDMHNIVEESLRSGGIASAITIGMAVAPRIYNHIVLSCKEGRWQPDLLKNTFQGTGDKALEAGLRGSIATSITMSAKAGLLGEATRAVDPTLVGTLTFLVFEGAKDFSKYRKGELDVEHLTDSLMRKSVTATAGAYGATIGQIIIPIPIVGAMCGAMVGSIIAQNGYEFLNKFTDLYFRSEDFEEMKIVTVGLSSEWNYFVSSYDDWQAKSLRYQEEKQKHLSDLSKVDIINHDLNQQLLSALEKDDLEE